MFMCSSLCPLLFGLFFILMGASIIINIFFGISVPVFKLFFAGFLIYMGIRMLISSRYTGCSYWSFHSSEGSKEACSFEKDKTGDNYELRFGTSTVDLRSLNALTEPKTVRVQVQFANATVILPADVPVRVKTAISFSNLIMPGRDKNSEYVNLHGAAAPLLRVLIESDFSSVVVRD